MSRVQVKYLDLANVLYAVQRCCKIKIFSLHTSFQGRVCTGQEVSHLHAWLSVRDLPPNRRDGETLVSDIVKPPATALDPPS